MNPTSILAFEAPNKADAIVIQATKNIPYHAQNYIREKCGSDEPKHFVKFMQNAFCDPNMTKRDPRIEAGRAFYLRCKQGTQIYNFEDEAIVNIIRWSNSRKPKEIVEQLFPELRETGEINKRASAVSYIQNALGLEYLGPAVVLSEIEELESQGEWVPPLKDETVISRINKSVPNVDWAKHRLDSFQKRCVRVLKGNLSLLKFCVTINSYKMPLERQLFEGEFIRSCYAKPDMIEDDVNQCMMLAEEYVRSIQIRETMNLFDSKMKAALQGDDKTGMSMSFAENYNAKTRELEKCQTNIKSIQKTLNESYSKRKEMEAKTNDSLLPYIMAVCDEQKRKDLLNYTKAYSENILKPEIDKLVETDDKIGEVHGISISEIFGFKHDINE